jgi:hypothetical protein
MASELDLVPGRVWKPGRIASVWLGWAGHPMEGVMRSFACGVVRQVLRVGLLNLAPSGAQLLAPLTCPPCPLWLMQLGEQLSRLASFPFAV